MIGFARVSPMLMKYLAVALAAAERVILGPHLKLSAPALERGAPRRRHKTTTFVPNGAREVARRRRQIAAGQLRRENGLSA